MIVFDLETGPLPWGILKDRIPPFDEEKAVPHPGEFDPASVKCGNLSADKAAAKIEEARAAHELAVKAIAARRAEARNAHVEQCTAKAALSATTGCVKAIGLGDHKECSLWVWGEGVAVAGPDLLDGAEDCFVLGFESERHLLERFWRHYLGSARESFVGHNIHGFDLPFLVCRSWILGVDVPDGVQQQGGRYWSNQFVDTMARWNCGNRNYIKLDEIDRALGGEGKPDDCTGADFARLFDNGGEDRINALKYLRSDLAMTRRVAEAMQIL